MRLVSQNGNVDIPYDKAVLLHAQDYVMARVGDKEYLMGEYSSMKKSYRVMEMLREKYAKLEIFNSVYQKGLLTELNKELGFDEMQNILTSIFQFPKDEEVEV